MTHRTLTADELLRLPEAGLVDIGGHPMSHPALSTLARAEQRPQIQTSNTMLEQMLHDRVISFAYPLGSGTPETVALAGEAGFLRTCLSDADVVFRAAARLRLARPCLRDNDGGAFAGWLRWWLAR
jgi:peptidoglycan/xylan/chitin deacetylase (PgdA/CDA1 family)